MYAQKAYRGFESLSLRHRSTTLHPSIPGIQSHPVPVLRNIGIAMSYLVLARKWRPQKFDDVIGQPHVARTLQNAVTSGRIAHAYLFTGARGVGKTSVARILAKALNCERGASAHPCNECSNCREVTQGNAIDVLEIDGASNRGIDSIRELRETVRYRPAKGRYKIYIIDEVHMLTSEAFNALLKTLEEPPERVVFIFATTEPHKIPATILSRCQRFDFRRIPTSMLVKHLLNIAAQEKMELSESVIYSIAREADGSMRDAQSLLEQLLAFSGDGMDDTEILDILGVVDRQSVHKVGHAILTGDVRACLEAVEDLYRRGTDSKRFCRQLCDHFRNLLFFSMDGAREEGGALWIDLPEEEREALREEAELTSPESLYLYFQMVIKGEDEIRRSSMPRAALEMMLLRLTQLPRLESLDALLHKLSSFDATDLAQASGSRSASRRQRPESRGDEPPLPSRAGPGGPAPSGEARGASRGAPAVHQNNGGKNREEDRQPVASPHAGSLPVAPGVEPSGESGGDYSPAPPASVA